MNFRLIDTFYNNAAMNMAVDEVLLKSKTPVLRFYQWKPAALSLGYFQDIDDINLKECKKRKVDVVRRITGGKTVLHDKELTYSLIIDEKHMPKSIINSYKKISQPILYALNQFGIQAEMKKDVIKNKKKSAVCFNEPSYYEIVVNNRKLVGSAQTRKQGKLLQHGSILLDIDYRKLISLFNLENKKEAVELSKKRITSVCDELTDEYKSILRNKKLICQTTVLGKLKQHLRHGFEKSMKINLIDDKLTEKELKLAKKLERNKYSKENWNIK